MQRKLHDCCQNTFRKKKRESNTDLMVQKILKVKGSKQYGPNPQRTTQD